jgi:hypothetical protein
MSPDTVKKRIDWNGIPIHIDRPKGFVMKGVDAKGCAWSRKYKYDYGYIPKTSGGDGDGLDVFIGPLTKQVDAYWAVQVKDDGTFDEYKVFLGFPNRDAAIATYREHIPKKMLSGMVTMKLEMMKAMLGIDSNGLRKFAAMSHVSFIDEILKIGEVDIGGVHLSDINPRYIPDTLAPRKYIRDRFREAAGTLKHEVQIRS